MSAEASTSGLAPRKRFAAQDDVFLLREVLAVNPFSNAGLWKAVVTGLNAASKKSFTVRGAKERVDLLITLHKRNDRLNLRKSGTEEQYQEKERLLLECAALYDEFGRNQDKISRRKRPASSTASQLREESLSWMTPESAEADAGDRSASTLLEAIYSVPSEGEEDVVAPAQPCSQEPTFSEVLRSNIEASSQSRPEPATRPTPQGGRKRNLSRGLEFLEMKVHAKNRLMVEEQKLRREQQAIENRRLQLEEARVELERDKQRHDAEMTLRKLAMEEEERCNQRQLINQQVEMVAKMVEQVVDTNQLLHQLLSKKTD